MIGIRADGNAAIGLGHLMRCICIGEEIMRRGQEVFFILAQDSDASLLKEKKIPYYRLNQEGRCGWDSREVLELLRKKDCNTLLVDTYRIEMQDFEILSMISNLIYLDDMYAFDYHCDCIINYNMEAVDKYSKSSYERKMCLGVDYFPLREEFCQESNREIAPNVEKVLVTTGSTDMYEIALKIVKYLAPKYRMIEFSVLEGKYYQEEYKDKIRTFVLDYCNTRVIPWGQNMAELYKKMDLVISPGSTSIYEALSMNVPCISYEFAENQHEQCSIMDKLHMVPYLGDFREMDQRKYEHLGVVFEKALNYERRKKQSHIFSSRLDKGGTKRIADVIMRMDKSNVQSN